MRKTRANGYKFYWERFHPDIGFFFKFFFFNSGNNHLYYLHRGIVESPLLKIFKMQVGRMLDNLIQVPLYSQKVGPDDVLRSVPTWVVL